jgi:hypothetical protein
MEKNYCSTGKSLDKGSMTAGNQQYWGQIQDYLAGLQDNSHRLGEAAVQGELAIMTDLVSQRQLIINRWAKLPLPRDLPLPPPEEIEHNFRELLTKGKNLVNHLTIWRTAVLERIKSLDKGQRLLGSYNKGGAMQPRFLDLRQ